MLLSRPDMVKPTSQVQRVEPRKCVQFEGRTEEKGEDEVGDETELGEGEDTEEDEDPDRAAEIGKEEADEEKEAMLEVLLRPGKKESGKKNAAPLLWLSCSSM